MTTRQAARTIHFPTSGQFLANEGIVLESCLTNYGPVLLVKLTYKRGNQEYSVLQGGEYEIKAGPVNMTLYKCIDAPNYDGYGTLSSAAKRYEELTNGVRESGSQIRTVMEEMVTAVGRQLDETILANGRVTYQDAIDWVSANRAVHTRNRCRFGRAASEGVKQVQLEWTHLACVLERE